MKSNNKVRVFYICMFLLLAISIAALLMVNDDSIKSLLTVASITPIVVMLTKFMLDQIKGTISFIYEKQNLAYEMSMSSNIAYDIQKKYLEFCEQYIQQVYIITECLFKKGNTEESLEYSNQLFGIRKSYSLYIPETVYRSLYEFEYVLRRLGAGAGFQNDTICSKEDELLRKQSIQETYRLFRQLMDKQHGDDNREVKYYEDLISDIRKTAGIDEMFRIKNEFLEIR